MNSNDRAGSIIAALIIGGLVSAIFMISSCVKSDNDNDAKLQMACIEKGGIWTYAGARTFTCNLGTKV